jgi:drug/metabolite transporter (DMT)-like permease
LPGYLAAASVMLIWATWLVVSRSGAQSSLTAFDLAAMRYGISAVFTLPIVLYFKPWQNMPLKRIVAWLWNKEKAVPRQLLGVVMIVVGAALTVADAAQLSLSESWKGDLMFFTGAIFFSGYLIISRRWAISTTQILLCSSVINAIIYVPIWFFFLPSGISEAPQSQLLLQGFYQGLIPNLVGLLLVAYAVCHVGSAATAAFMAAVPAMGTILSLIFLGEVPGWLGWLSLAVLTPGIVLVAVIRR